MIAGDAVFTDIFLSSDERWIKISANPLLFLISWCPKYFANSWQKAYTCAVKTAIDFASSAQYFSNYSRDKLWSTCLIEINLFTIIATNRHSLIFAIEVSFGSANDAPSKFSISDSIFVVGLKLKRGECLDSILVFLRDEDIAVDPTLFLDCCLDGGQICYKISVLVAHVLDWNLIIFLKDFSIIWLLQGLNCVS